MGLETDFARLTNGMIPKITPPISRTFSPPSLLWLAPAIVADLMGRAGGNEFRDNQLEKLGRKYDPNTGLSAPSNPYFGGQTTDKVIDTGAPRPVPTGLADGWNRTYYTDGNPNGFTIVEDVSIRYNPATTFAWIPGYTQQEITDWGLNARDQRTAVRLVINGVTGAREGTGDGTPIIDIRWYFVGDGSITKRYPEPTIRDGDTSTKGDDNTTDRQRKAGGSPPPPFTQNRTNTTISNITNNTTNNNTTINNDNTDRKVSNVTNNNYNFNGDVNKSFSPPPPLIAPSTPPLVKPAIAPPPLKKEEEKKVPPPFTPPVFNGDIGTQLAFLGGTLATI